MRRTSLLPVLMSLAIPSAADDEQVAIRDLRYGAPSARIRAAARLAEGCGAEGIEALISTLRDRNWWVRYSVARALGRLIAGAPSATPHLVAATNDRSWQVRKAACAALANTSDSRGLAALLRRLDDRVPLVCAEAASSIGRLGPKAGPAVPALVRTFASRRRAFARREAAASLGKIGRAAATAVPRLLAGLAHSDRILRQVVLEALVRIGPHDLEPYAAALRHRDERVRSGTARALGNMGAAAYPAASLLVRAAADRAWHVRRNAVLALAKLAAADRLPSLAGLLDPGARLRSIEWTLASDDRQPLVRSVLSTLRGTLDDRRPQVRSASLRALGLLGWQASGALPRLVGSASDPDPEVRRSAMWAIARIRRSMRR